MGRAFCSHRPPFTSTAPPLTSITSRPRSGIAITKSPSPSQLVFVRTRSECHAVQPFGQPRRERAVERLLRVARRRARAAARVEAGRRH